MSKPKNVLKEFVNTVLSKKETLPANDNANVTQTLTQQQVDARLNDGCPVCDGSLINKPRMGEADPDTGHRQYKGSYYVCSKHPNDHTHYNLSAGTNGGPGRELFRGDKPQTADAIVGPKPNDGSRRVIRRTKV